MNDAIALLAISQLVCLGALFYLYMQLQEVRRRGPARRQPSARVHRMPGPETVSPPLAGRAARAAYAAPAGGGSHVGNPARSELAALVARSNGAIDIPAISRYSYRLSPESRCS